MSVRECICFYWDVVCKRSHGASPFTTINLQRGINMKTTEAPVALPAQLIQPPTPEAITAALQYLTNATPTTTASNEVAPPEQKVGVIPKVQESTESTTLDHEDSEGVIDQEKKQELETLFAKTINNPRYWENPNRVKRLEEALALPRYDDRSMQQFYNSATDELKDAAFNKALQNECAPVMPTEEEICALAEKKHADKLAKLAKKAARKS